MDSQDLQGFKFTLLDDGTYSVTGNSDNSKKLTKLVIPSEYNGKPITQIGVSAFEDCIKLKSVTIPSSVTTIGTYAFSGCKKLKTVVLSQGLKHIGILAFAHCSSLTNIELPSSVTTIENYAFDGCVKLKNIPTIEEDECDF